MFGGSAEHDPRKDGGERDTGRSAGSREEIVFAAPENPEAATDARSGVRPAGGAGDHGHGEELLRGAGRDSSNLAASSRAVQGLHRHAASESVPIAAYDGDSFGAAV